MKSYESINSLSSERKRSGGAATPRSIDEEATSTPELGEGTDDKSAPISLESLPATAPSEDEPYYDQVPVDSINDGEYVYIQAGKNKYNLIYIVLWNAI